MHYIYHIPDWEYKDGRIGKIGCTQFLEGPKKRKTLKIADKKGWKWEVLEEHTDRRFAGKRERELQEQYGYRVDKDNYEHVTTVMLQASMTKQARENRS